MAVASGNASGYPDAGRMAEVVWSREAADDVERITRYIALFRPLAAQRMAVRLRAAAASLRDYPEQGQIVRGRLRQLVVVKPYVIRYRLDDGSISIIFVRHGARRIR